MNRIFQIPASVLSSHASRAFAAIACAVAAFGEMHPANACQLQLNSDPAYAESKSLKIRSVSVEYYEEIDSMIFRMDLEGPAGKTAPKVKEFKKEDKSIILPPPNCGMPMYLDSPGHAVAARGSTIRVAGPAYYMPNQTSFNFDGVRCYMQVNTSCMSRTMLGAYEVYSIGSKDLSLPYKSK